MARLPSLMLACALLCSCSDDDKKPDVDSAVPDAKAPDAVASPEGGQDLAAGDASPVADQAGGDGPLSACDPALDIAPLALDPSYCVVQRFALPAKSDAVGLRGNSVYVFALDATPAGNVSEAAIDPLTGKPGTYSTLFSFTPGLSGTLYAGAYLALSPAGYAAAGYTVDTTFDGQIYWGNKGITTPKLVDKASGNFDVVFLDNQTLLINGTGVGTAQDGQGVYLYQEGKTPRRLIKDIGVASGFMALGKKVLYAGGYFSAGSQIYGFSLAEVQAAISGGGTLTPAADGDLVLDGSAGDATALGDQLIVTKLDSSWSFDRVTAIPVSVNGDTVTPGTAADLVTASGGATLGVSGLAAASGGRLGLVLQGTGSAELAVVQPK